MGQLIGVKAGMVQSIDATVFLSSFLPYNPSLFFSPLVPLGLLDRRGESKVRYYFIFPGFNNHL